MHRKLQYDFYYITFSRAVPASNAETTVATSRLAGRSAAMSHYFLHLHNRTGFTRDDEGLELADLAAARDEAIRNIRGILSSEILGGRVDLNGRVEIADGDGTVLAVVQFTDAVQLTAEA